MPRIEKEIVSIRLFTDNDCHNVREFKIEDDEGERENEQQGQDELIENFYATHPDFGDEQGCYLQVFANRIVVFDKAAQVSKVFSNFNFKTAVNASQRYLYVAADSHEGPVLLDDRSDESATLGKPKPLEVTQKEGLYVFNVVALLRGAIERYRVSQYGTGGCSSLIEYNVNLGRLAYLEDFSTIVVQSLPQLNTMNFIGMRNKHEYVIWREKNGFFTAMNRKAELVTWSILTGKRLYRVQLQGELWDLTLKHYSLQRADAEDITYTRDFYNLENSSICLLRSHEAIDEGKRSYDQQKLGGLYGLGLAKIDVAQLAQEDEDSDEETTDFAGMLFDHCNEIFQEKDTFKTLDTTLRFRLYHFQVLELQTYEDTGRPTSCKVLFTFVHKIIKKNKDESIADGGAADLECDLGVDPMQRLYLSRDTERMMEVINNRFAIVYRRYYVDTERHASKDEQPGGENQDGEAESAAKSEAPEKPRFVKWAALFKIKRWPSSLSTHTSVPYMFSPNFTYQLDFNYAQKTI